MTRLRGPSLGPWSKTAAWRGGSFLVGMITMLWILHVALGDLFDLSLLRLPLIMVLTGLVMTIPFGVDWLRGDRKPIGPPPPRPAFQTDIHDQDGRTVVVVTPPKASPPPAGPRRAVKSKELSFGWWAVYTLVWRWPVLLGDAILCGLWGLVGRLIPQERPTRTDHELSQMDQIENHPPPESRTF